MVFAHYAEDVAPNRLACVAGSDDYLDLVDEKVDGEAILDRLMATHGGDPAALAKATQPLDGRQRNMLDAAISLRFGGAFTSRYRRSLVAGEDHPSPVPEPPTKEEPEAGAEKARLDRFKQLQVETELISMQTLAELKLARSLGPDEVDRMRVLARERVDGLYDLARLAESRRYWEAEREKWEMQAFVARQRERGLEPLGDSVEQRGVAGEMWQQVKRLGEVPGVIEDGTVDFVEEHGVRTEQLARDAFDHGNVLGPAFAPLVVAGEMELEGVDTGLTQATQALEQAIAARDGYDKVISAAMAALGLGSAALSAYGIAEPIAAMTEGGVGAGTMGGAAAVRPDGGIVAMAGASSAVAPLSLEGITASVTGQSVRYEQDEIANEYINETQSGRGDDKADRVTKEEVADAEAMHETSPREAGAKSGVQHHVFPQDKKYREWFKAHHIDIHDLTVRLPEADHQAIHGGGDYKLARKVWPKEWNQRVWSELQKAEATTMKLTRKPLSRERVISIVEGIMRAGAMRRTSPRSVVIGLDTLAKATKTRSTASSTPWLRWPHKAGVHQGLRTHFSSKSSSVGVVDGLTWHASGSRCRRECADLTLRLDSPSRGSTLHSLQMDSSPLLGTSAMRP